MDRVRNWYKNKQELVLNSEYPQARKFTGENEINVESKSNKYIKRWIYMLKEIKRRLEKHKLSNIRAFLS